MMKITNFEKRLGVRTIAELRSYDAVIISGASSGIGESFVRVLDSVHSPKICNFSRSFPNILSDRQNFLNVPSDLQKKSDLLNAFEEARSWLNLDESLQGKAKKILLINNAGFGAYGYFPAPTVERNCDMIDLNVRALTHLTGLFLPYIKAGKGSIINIASTASFQACPNLSVYAATKSYVKSFSLALNYELRQSGAKCLCVCPGPTSSNFFSAAGFDSPPLPSTFGHRSDEVAICAYRALGANSAIKIVGWVNNIQAFITRFVPYSLLTKISGKILDKIRKM